jgi:hypothetical protein
VTGADKLAIDAAVRHCLREAAKSASEVWVVETPFALVSCQAFKRDGGGAGVEIEPPTGG